MYRGHNVLFDRTCAVLPALYIGGIASHSAIIHMDGGCYPCHHCDELMGTQKCYCHFFLIDVDINTQANKSSPLAGSYH